MSLQIIATLGPASASAEGVRALLDAGATGLRVNGSHTDPEQLGRYLDLAEAGGAPLSAVVLDLQGGKTRLAHWEGEVQVTRDAPVTLTGPDGPGALRVDREELIQALRPGDALRVDDGRYAFEVLAVSSTSATLRPLQTAALRPRKGVSVPGRPLHLPPRLLGRDLALAEIALGRGVGEVALSFASEVGWLAEGRSRLPGVRLTAKLEQPQAIDAIDALSEAADSLWLCRGDLGAEAGLTALSALQRGALDAGRPLLVAGQVLHHMTYHPRPTRAEVCQVGDLLYAGALGFVLSDETATGPHGPAAVRLLHELARGAPPPRALTPER
ncbi:MAG: hypothetical protein JXX28_15995 [Deltaproteobacteria bacterium]|nr:hypothetical protein [Deltaproteobacteria bacterium]